ncbi:UNVERIFIED_CONTAM: hypothetical protein PYX00_007031 [Menopon gallinae]|uniref:Major facilitator superfamily (MFS) profile domain-containing protein n=1 Tax=Menopon gallinae TaxID=328185 RepID=A0AAW2HH99_9NEOP
MNFMKDSMMAVHNWLAGTRLGAKLSSCKESRKLILIIVAIALLLDNMVLTTVVPIIPEFLYEMRHPNETKQRFNVSVTTTTTTTPATIFINQGTESNMTTGSFERKLSLNFTTMSPDQQKEEERHRDLNRENIDLGIMFASKAFVQLIANSFIGPLTHRIGYSIPMFAGFIILFLSTIIFAFGRSYSVLFVARALQGVGSSCSSVSGMGMLAQQYPDDKERGNAMGIALGGLALGVLIGPPFGGFMSEFVGKSVPFLLLSVLALGDGLLQLMVLQPSVVKTDLEPPSLKSLISDPYILIASGAISFANMGIAMLEPSLTIHMIDKMKAEQWQQGVVFLPASISYLIGTNLFGPLGHRMGRWLAALLGLIIIGCCLIWIPSAQYINQLIAPNAGLGFAIGMVDSSMMPELGFLVDIRHSAIYGSVYAIGDVAFCLGFAVGPALSGTLVSTLGFDKMLYGVAILNFLYAPLLLMLRSPPSKEEKKSLVTSENSTCRYVTYQNEEEDE